MTNKEQIEEMAKLCCPFQFNEETCFDKHCNDTGCWALPIAETLYEAGYRKVSKEDIIIIEDENLKNLNHTATCVRELKAKIRKETAKEIYAFLINHCNLHYIDIHNLITFIKEEYGVEIKE